MNGITKAMANASASGRYRILLQATNAADLADDQIGAIHVPKPSAGRRYIAINTFFFIGFDVGDRWELRRDIIIKRAMGVV